jgi:hypothetical protein
LKEPNKSDRQTKSYFGKEEVDLLNSRPYKNKTKPIKTNNNNCKQQVITFTIACAQRATIIQR